MEVHITSKQMIKPSSSSQLHLLKPFKLSLLDQFSLTHYVPYVFFYTKPFDSQFSERLKRSLSKTLAQFYPLAGRTKNNSFISDYDEGVPYIETSVKCRISDFIERTRDELEEMNQLLPCRPYCSIRDYSVVPQLSIQVNTFECGGIAIALCCFHKIIDATTTSAFLKSWTAFSRGAYDEIPNIRPDLLGAGSRLFPPVEWMMPLDLKPNEGHRCKTRSFVFDANAIATLKLKARTESLEHPSRVVALGAFLWKHAIKASCTSVSGTPKEAVLCVPVSIRKKLKPELPDYSIGNLFLMPVSTYNPVKKDIELTELAYKVTEALKMVTTNTYAEEESVTRQLSETASIVSKGNVEIYGLSSWLNLLDGNEDFGWGKPASFSIPGFDSDNRECVNVFFLKKARQHNAIEAWVTLSDEAMGVLEQDSEFLAFASPIPTFTES